MKQLNFPKLQHLLYVVVGILLVISIITCIAPLKAFAATSTFDSRLLVIVEDSAEKPSLDDEDSDMVEFKHLSEISSKDSGHIAYAVSKTIANNSDVNSIIKYAFNNLDARIYIYGDLTISEFKEILGIDAYSVQTDIYDEDGITGEKANMTFSEEQEQNKIEQIICLSKNPKYQSLIVSAPNATLTSLENIIIKHYSDTFVNPMLYATIVQNAFNYRNYTYFSPGTDYIMDNCYLNMDYYLYKIEEENVADYDYFAIRVNVNPIHDYHPAIGSNLPCTSFQVKLNLPYSSDHIYEYGPYSSSKAKDINVSLGFGDSGVSGSIGFTFSPGSGPTVNANYNSANRTVSWEVKQYWFFGSRLNDAIYPFGASWASTGRLAAINISTFVEFDKAYKSNWNEIQVRYSY